MDMTSNANVNGTVMEAFAAKMETDAAIEALMNPACDKTTVELLMEKKFLTDELSYELPLPYQYIPELKEYANIKAATKLFAKVTVVKSNDRTAFEMCVRAVSDEFDRIKHLYRISYPDEDLETIPYEAWKIVHRAIGETEWNQLLWNISYTFDM